MERIAEKRDGVKREVGKRSFGMEESEARQHEKRDDFEKQENARHPGVGANVQNAKDRAGDDDDNGHCRRIKPREDGADIDTGTQRQHGRRQHVANEHQP